MTIFDPDVRPQGAFVAGVGCTTAATLGDLVALIDSCLAHSRIDPTELVAIGTHARKRASAELAAAAAHYGVPLRFFADDEFELARGVSEGVAAVAGAIVLHKQKSATATCALARCGSDFVLADYGQPPSPSASMAASSVSTSRAGP